MTVALSSILCIVLCAVFINHASAQSPPQLLEEYAISQYIVRPGQSATLTCPVRGTKDTLIFEWSKEKESLMAFGGQRLRITGNGALKIKETILDDTGLYTCRAVNGFGSVEFNTTLLVMGDDEDYEHQHHYDDMEDFGFDQGESASRKSSMASKPRMLSVSKGDSPFYKLPGSSMEMYCVATGVPKPDIVWYKDGHQISKAYRRGRFTIKLQRLMPPDSGNYTCVANNFLGSTSHSFIISVDDASISHQDKPLIWGSDPSNITVVEGKAAVMQCVARSSYQPHIKWLKQVDKSKLSESELQSALKIRNDVFRTLNSSEVINRKDGTFYNKFLIARTQLEDEGKYVCLVANQFGYSYRDAHLRVTSKPSAIMFGSSIPFPIVVTVTVVAVAAIAGIFSLLVYCRGRRRTVGGSHGVPMVTKETFLAMQHGSNGNSRISIEAPRGRSKQQSAVYVPAANVNEFF